MTTDARLHHAGIDGRFAFALAVLLAGIGFLALMDRIGVPEGLVQALAVIFVLFGLVTAAALLRTMRVSWFYAAGRAVPAPYAGLAMAGLGAALFMPFIPPMPQGTSLTELFAGFACGIACAGLVTGPFLRKTGAFSIPDLITARFPHLAARLGAILLTAVVAILIALTGYQEAVLSLMAISSFNTLAASAIIASLLALIVLPGGLAGTLWAATAAAVIAVTVLGLPLLTMVVRGTPLAFPFFGQADLWANALLHIEAWTGATQAKTHMDLVLIAAIALGLGALAPLLSVSVGCEGRRTAQRAGLAALIWGAILILLATATLAQTTLAFDHALVGQAPDALSPSLYQASTDGDLTLCGATVTDKLAARRACASRPGFANGLQMQDVTVKGMYLLTNFAKFDGFGSAFAGLMSAVFLVFGLVLAAAGIQSGATVIGNDLFYRVRDHAALTSRRLAITRAFAIAILIFCGSAVAVFAMNPQILIASAILLSASGLAPLLILTLWPRATSFDATVTLLMGIFTGEALIGVPLASGLDRFAASALIACGAGLLAGVLTSLARRHSDDYGGSFTKAMINDAGEWLHPDKGA